MTSSSSDIKDKIFYGLVSKFICNLNSFISFHSSSSFVLVLYNYLVNYYLLSDSFSNFLLTVHFFNKSWGNFCSETKKRFRENKEKKKKENQMEAHSLGETSID